ncbi:MAG: hypothetical protein R2832_11860 [Rhodothermales bacterium]
MICPVTNDGNAANRGNSVGPIEVRHAREGEDEVCIDSITRANWIRGDGKALRSEYLTRWQFLSENEYSSAAAFDKGMMTLSASGLALSLSLFGVLDDPLTAIPLLRTSWICFALSLLFVLVSLYHSERAFKERREASEIEYRRISAQLEREFQTVIGQTQELGVELDMEASESAPSDSEDRRGEAMKALDALSLGLFAVASLTLVWFMFENLSS